MNFQEELNFGSFIRLHNQNGTWPAWFQKLKDLSASNPTQRNVLKFGDEDIGQVTGLSDKITASFNLAQEKSLPTTVAEELLLIALKHEKSCTTDPLSIHNNCIQTWRKQKTNTESFDIKPIHLPILLLKDYDQQGKVALLTLWNTGVDASEAKSCFVPAPASFLLSCDDEFTKGFQDAQNYIKNQLGSQKIPFIVWDLQPLLEDTPIITLRGGSASASIAVGALCALRDLFETSYPKLSKNLGQIETRRAAITAQIDYSGQLTAIVGLAEKLVGIIEDYNRNSTGHPLRVVYVAANQSEVTTLDARLSLSPHKTVHSLIEELSVETNPDKLFGVRPDVVLKLRDKLDKTVDFYDGFTGRDWLKKQIQDSIVDIKGRGIISVVAPAGWGKSAFALHLVEQIGSESSLLSIDGYAFVRRESGTTIGRFNDLTTDAKTVIRQLNNCTRHQLNMSKIIDESHEAASILETLLKDCSELAKNDARSSPIILLLDAADELTSKTLHELLPEHWPNDVILLVTSRASGLKNIPAKSDQPRPIRTISVGEADCIKNTEQDIRKYIEHRNKNITEKYKENLEEAVIDAIVNACRDPESGQLFFLVAHGLLAERDDLLVDIKKWGDNPSSLPKGVKDYIEKQIKRSIEKTKELLVNRCVFTDNDMPEKFTKFLLGFVAVSEVAWLTNDFDKFFIILKGIRLQHVITALNAFGVNYKLFPDHDLNEYEYLWQGLQDLFNANQKNYKTSFTHALYRESVLQSDFLSKEQLVALHSLWGSLCEDIWQQPDVTNANPAIDDCLLDYALQHGSVHLAKGDKPLLAAQRLLDCRPMPQKGYLDVMYDRLKENALAFMMQGIQQVNAACGRIEKRIEYAEWLMALDSLRFVLSQHDPYLKSGEIALLPTLYNAMAGYFTEQTVLGKHLRDAIEQYTKPWMKSLHPDAAQAFGPIVHHLGSDITCMAHSEDGEWIAAGLDNGEVWVWSKLEVMNGFHGTLVIDQIKGRYIKVIAIGTSVFDGYIIAAGTDNGYVYIQTQRELNSKHIVKEFTISDQFVRCISVAINNCIKYESDFIVVWGHQDVEDNLVVYSSLAFNDIGLVRLKTYEGEKVFCISSIYFNDIYVLFIGFTNGVVNILNFFNNENYILIKYLKKGVFISDIILYDMVGEKRLIFIIQDLYSISINELCIKSSVEIIQVYDLFYNSSILFFDYIFLENIVFILSALENDNLVEVHAFDVNIKYSENEHIENIYSYEDYSCGGSCITIVKNSILEAEILLTIIDQKGLNYKKFTYYQNENIFSLKIIDQWFNKFNTESCTLGVYSTKKNQKPLVYYFNGNRIFLLNIKKINNKIDKNILLPIDKNITDLNVIKIKEEIIVTVGYYEKNWRYQSIKKFFIIKKNYNYFLKNDTVIFQDSSSIKICGMYSSFIDKEASLLFFEENNKIHGLYIRNSYILDVITPINIPKSYLNFCGYSEKPYVFLYDVENKFILIYKLKSIIFDGQLKYTNITNWHLFYSERYLTASLELIPDDFYIYENEFFFALAYDNSTRTKIFLSSKISENIPFLIFDHRKTVQCIKLLVVDGFSFYYLVGGYGFIDLYYINGSNVINKRRFITEECIKSLEVVEVLKDYIVISAISHDKVHFFSVEFSSVDNIIKPFLILKAPLSINKKSFFYSDNSIKMISVYRVFEGIAISEYEAVNFPT